MVMKKKKSMIVYLLGILDILVGISLLLLKFNVEFIPIFFAGFVAVKGLAFIKNIASIADIACGFIFFYAIYSGYFGIFAYMAVIWLIQKGVFSLLKIA